jgi:aminopeptidase
MLSQKTIENYCEITLKLGVNLQRGQGVEIICPVEHHSVAVIMTKKAYELGASIVRIRWSAEKVDRLNYIHADENELVNVPKWYVDSKNDLVDKNFCYVALISDDPNCFNDVPSQRLAKATIAKSKALKRYFNAVTSNKIRWCLASLPSYEWAKTVFPNSENPQEDLTNAIIKSMRLDKPNPLKEWEKHISNLEKRTAFLNQNDFEYLHFSNSIGTDLTVGLCQDHVWLSAKEKAQDGIDFIANLPTEEVFTAPHRLKVDGVVKSAKPLSLNGKIIDQFSLTFKNGKVVDYSAKVGEDVLKTLLETDKGTVRLGEVALIGKNSPISKSGILFYNTLFDENASCHLALGKAYPTTVKNGTNLSGKELMALGANDSLEHEDFMIGTPDLKVVGIKKDKTQVLIFNNGEWVI